MVRVNLAILLAKKKMSVLELHKLTGIRYRTLTDYFHEMALSIKFEHIDKICSALGCSVGDLIEYIPEEQRRKRGRPKNLNRKPERQ